MFFFIAGTSTKSLRKDTVKINKNGLQVNARVEVLRNYISVFFIPLIPLGKIYRIYIPHSDEYYEETFFSKMPKEYLEICKEVGRK